MSRKQKQTLGEKVMEKLVGFECKQCNYFAVDSADLIAHEGSFHYIFANATGGRYYSNTIASYSYPWATDTISYT